jgi:choline dehydrogenase
VFDRDGDGCPLMFSALAPALIRRSPPGARIWQMFPDEHGFTYGANVGRPLSRGEVRLRSADPAAPPLIDTGYFTDPADMRAIVSSIQRLREMMQARVIRDVIRAELQPGPERRTDAEVEEDVRDKGDAAYHPMGTCRMGGDADSVLDPQLRVRGVEGLRVADNSVMPTPLCAATHGPAVMIGERASALIAGA